MNLSGTKNMTVGNYKKCITQFAIPIMLSQLFQQFYNSADSYIVGKYLGDNALAAVSSSGPLIFLLISFFTGTSMGAGVVMSKYFGAGDYKRLSKAIHTNIALGLLCSSFLTLFGTIMTPMILKAMGVDKNILPESITYFRYYFIGIIWVILYNICKSIMNSVGDSKRPLIYLIITSIINIILDIVFITKIGMGVEGAAIATIIAQIISVILCLSHLLKRDTIYQVRLKDIKIDKEMFIEMCKYGLPTGIQNSVIGFANVLVQTNINSFGKEATAGCGAYSKIEGFAFLPVTSFSMALSTYVGQNLGANKSDRTLKGSRFGIIVSVIMAEIIGIITFIYAPQLIGIFSAGKKVIQIGVKQARTVSLFYCLLSFSHCIAGICRGAGKAVVPMMVMLGVWCVTRITYITVAMKIKHEIGLLFWAYPLTWLISSIIFLVYYKKLNWIKGFSS